MTELGAIPGPDPGACPDCGQWRKAGMRHECRRDPTTREIADTLMSYSECLAWAERFKATPFNMLPLATVAARAASPVLVMRSLFALAARVQELEAERVS